MISASFSPAICAGFLMLVCHAAAAQTYTYTFIAPPGSTDTRPVALGNSGAVLGTWSNQASSQGFIFQNGTYANIAYPGANATAPTGFNEKGEVVGSYTDTQGVVHAFLYHRGLYTTINAPNASTTEIVGIDKKGVIAGESSAGLGPDFTYKSGHFTTFVDRKNPVPVGINDSGTVIGVYYPNSLKTISSYLYNGSTLITIPVHSHDAECEGLNNKNDVVGTNYDNEVQKGFLYKNGKVHSIDFPGAAGTNLFAISDRGDITGYYQDSNYHEVAFVLSKGVFTTLSPPNSVGSFGRAVNNAGQVLGSYHDSNGVIYTFVATPSA